MRYPHFLKEGGRIGFIAPSYGVATEPYISRFASALERFADLGYQTVLGPNCYKHDGCGKSTSAGDCAAEAMDFLANDHCDVIISCGGGETMCEDLEYMDFDVLAAADPKWFMGYSDNTNFVFTLTTLADTAAIYGPCAGSFGMRRWHPAIEDAFGLLRGERLKLKNYGGWEPMKEEPDPLAGYDTSREYNMQIFRGREPAAKAEFNGRLLGGCIDCLTILCGTKYDGVKDFNQRYAADGTLWFLEACELNPMGVRRCLWQLREAGWFDTACGFMFGRPMLYDERFGQLGYVEAIMSVLGDMDLPILIDIDLGHLPPMLPMISGAIGYVSACEKRFDIKMELK